MAPMNSQMETCIGQCLALGCYNEEEYQHPKDLKIECSAQSSRDWGMQDQDAGSCRDVENILPHL